MHRFFHLFDTDSSGYVNFTELASGLSLLCGGSREERVRAAFELYDTNSDGVIALGEMAAYLTAVFTVTGTAHLGVTPRELAHVTAEQAFLQAELDANGKLSYEEFRLWFSRGAAGAGSDTNTDEQAQVVAASSNAPTRQQQFVDLFSIDNWLVDDVFELIASGANESGMIEADSFKQAVIHIATARGNYISVDGQEALLTMASELFALFVTDDSDAVDFTELASGLSILCGGSHEDKVSAAFALYDVEGTGRVAFDEMISYITSLYKVRYAFHGDTVEATVDLAEEAAEKAVGDASVNHNGALTRDEFREIYLAVVNDVEEKAQATNDTMPGAVAPLPSWMSLQEVRRLTNLQVYDVKDIFTFFGRSSDNAGQLSKQRFFRCFNKLIAKAGGQDTRDQQRAGFVLEKIFNAFDTQGEGFVDFSELASGLSILCGGERGDKVEAAFSLFDFDGNGYITLEEMATYLHSVFRMLYEVSPETRANMGVQPDELAMATALQCFEDADLDADAMLSFDEFKRWYTRPTEMEPNDDANALLDDPDDGYDISLALARRVTNLEHCRVRDVAQLFKAAAGDSNRLDRSAYNACFEQIVASAQSMSEDDMSLCEQIVDMFFDIFNTDTETFGATVDPDDLASGLSVLCGDEREEKVEAAFEMFDFDNNGFIDLSEMTRYLVSVFKVLYAVEPGTERRMGVSAVQLAAATAEQAFVEADTDNDGLISLHEFKAWYGQPSGAAHFVRERGASDLDVFPSWLTLAEARRLTNLQSKNVEDVMHLFENAANDAGRLDRAAFNTCFEDIVRAAGPMSDEDMGRCEQVVNGLFDLFDTDGDDHVDMHELSAGLTVLCGGERDQKVEAAFAMFDLDGNGFIDLDEMTRYLGSVFKVLYATTPGTEAKMGVSSDELARITAEEAFSEADTNNDNLISLDEFKAWYATQPNNNYASPNSADGDDGITLSEARRVTNLGNYDVIDVMRLFLASADENGQLTRPVYNECFQQIVMSQGEIDADSMTKCETIVDGLFDLFDTHSEDSVDVHELSAGLSCLCGGDREQKVEA
eukprot:g427.t1